jgi:putative protease
VRLSDEEIATLALPAAEQTAWIEQRNHFQRGEVLEVLTPQGSAWTFEVQEMWDSEGEPLEVARHAQQTIRMTVPRKIQPYSILRRAKQAKKQINLPL